VTSGFYRTRELLETAAFFLGVLVFLWFLVIPFPLAGVALLAPIILAWRRRSESLTSLGLGLRAFLRSFRAWSVIWAATGLAFFLFAFRALGSWAVLQQGFVYFVWSAAQQLVFQSMTYVPLRRSLTDARLAALIAGLAFALVHAPNPVLVPATLVWGTAACLLFERCGSVLGLALLQMMLSSMLMWTTPASLHHGFRIGPYYNQSNPPAFAPPIERIR
jgi:hypothetical protein